MMCSFFGSGQGSGASPTDYLVAIEVLERDANRVVVLDADGAPKMLVRDPAPDVLKGDVERTRHLIDGCKHKWTYTSGVLSFTDEDRPTEEQQREAMNGFEALAFAGLEDRQFDCLWVRHTHLGRVELHFLVPRIELTSGKSLNIAPPKSQPQFNTFVDMMNHRHCWADPRDPGRARDVKPKLEKAERAATREELHEQIFELIEAQLVIDRASMVTALHEMGWETPRLGKNYITAADPDSGEKFRLKGTIFDESWTVEDTLARATAPEAGPERRPSARLAGYADRELRDRYQRACRKRAEYNRQRYRPVHHLSQPEAGEPGPADRRLDRQGGNSGEADEKRASRLDTGRAVHADDPAAGRGADERDRGGIGGDAYALDAARAATRTYAGSGADDRSRRSGTSSAPPARKRSRPMSAALRIREHLREITKGEPIDADTAGARIADLRRRVDAQLRDVRGILERIRARVEALRDASARIESDLRAGFDALCRGLRKVADRTTAILGHIFQRPQAAPAIAGGHEPAERRADPPRPSPRSDREPDQRPRVRQDSQAPPPPKPTFEP
ncbi:MAG: relaxase/mobilization nuclease domain-containing protein [Verrucomicrobia bacterium]|nr:relaxase/mobilization nuclease domain-containing protein [Verrucomicrobiota bacterium]